MAKKNVQMDLIDVGPKPKDMKKLGPRITAYIEARDIRVAYLADEVKEKQAILEAIKKSDLKPLPDGTTVFTCNGMTIKITPRDEKISVKDAKTPKES